MNLRNKYKENLMGVLPQLNYRRFIGVYDIFLDIKNKRKNGLLKRTNTTPF